jgi:hypothetical protein
MDTGSFPGVKYGRGVLLTTHHLLVLWSWKSRAIPLPTLWATPGLQRGYYTFTFTSLFVVILQELSPGYFLTFPSLRQNLDGCKFEEERDAGTVLTKFQITQETN